MNKAIRTATLLIGAAAPLLAQEAGPAPPMVTWIHPAAEDAAARAYALVQQPEGGSTWSVLIVDGEGECRVEFRDGKLSAKIDGEVVPAERIQRRGGHIVILDDEGRVLRQIQDPARGARAQAFGGQTLEDLRNLSAELQLEPSLRGRLWVGGEAAQARERPRIGITMEPVGPALAAQLGLEEGRGIVITQVLDGMPAEKAGVKAYDVVIEVDGDAKVSEESLRKAISTKKAGDTVRLKVVRRGDRIEIPVQVEVVKEAPSDLSVQLGDLARRPDSVATLPSLELGRLWSEDARHEVRDALERAQAELREASERAAAEQRGRLEEAMKALEEARARLDERRDAVQRFGGAMRPFRLLQPEGGQGYYLYAPPGPEAPAAVDPEQSRRIEERIRGLEERLGRIEELLERMADR